MKSVQLVCLAFGLSIAGPLEAQTVPTIDTEDGTLGSADVGNGSLHPIASVDLRNGDFARGSFDDDAANLKRLPIHAQIGIGAELHRGKDDKADTWLVLSSSNGFHSPYPNERFSPRSWYESNNLVGFVATPTDGLRAAAIYTVKTSPNGVSDTTQEASASFAYDAKRGLGQLHPTLVATTRTQGDGGLYTQIGIEPEFELSMDDNAPKVSLPLAFGIGWGGFYEAGSGDRKFGSAGLAYSRAFRLGAGHMTFRAEMLALIRDDRLRLLSGPDGETSTVVPLGRIGLTMAY